MSDPHLKSGCCSTVFQVTVKATESLVCPFTTVASCTFVGGAQAALAAGSVLGTLKRMALSDHCVNGIGSLFGVNWLPAGEAPRLAPLSVTSVPGAAFGGSGAYKAGAPKVTSFLPR